MDTFEDEEEFQRTRFTNDGVRQPSAVVYELKNWNKYQEARDLFITLLCTCKETVVVRRRSMTSEVQFDDDGFRPYCETCQCPYEKEQPYSSDDRTEFSRYRPPSHQETYPDNQYTSEGDRFSGGMRRPIGFRDEVYECPYPTEQSFRGNEQYGDGQMRQTGSYGGGMPPLPRENVDSGIPHSMSSSTPQRPEFGPDGIRLLYYSGS